MRAKWIVLPALAAAAAAAAGVASIAALAGPDSSEAPDLRADPVENPFIELYDDSPPAGHGLGIGDRLLIRFDGFVTNVGDGPLEVSGNPQINDPENMSGVRQRARDSVTGAVDHVVGAPEVVFETADGHNHFHLQKVMRYSLWNTARTAEIAPGQKVGFCLYDIERASNFSGTPGAPVYTGAVTQFCDQNNRDTTDLVMGVSAGWRDTYHSGLSFQWVDVSNVPPGSYSLASEADPEDRVWEGDGANETNALAFAPDNVIVPGYLARPVSAPFAGKTEVTLAAQRIGRAEGLRYEIVSPPQSGTLDRAVGVPFTDPKVTYTPTGGVPKSDSFSYVAYQAGSPYPANPPAATAEIVGPDVALSISGAPARLVATTSAQLVADVTNGSGGAKWSVDGIPGGSGSVGTITPEGLYLAPAVPPPGGSVTIRATSVQHPGVFAEVVIGIDPVPPPMPAPAPTSMPTPSPTPTGSSVARNGGPAASVEDAPPLLTKPILYRRARNLYVRVEAGAGGRVTITGRHRQEKIGRCKATLVENQRFTCRLRLTRAQARTPKGISVVATIRKSDGETFRTAASLARKSKGAFQKPRATLKGRKLTVRSSIRRDGKVTAVIFVRGRQVGVCRRLRSAGTEFRCSRTLPNGANRKNVSVRLTLSKPISAAVVARRVVRARR